VCGATAAEQRRLHRQAGCPRLAEVAGLRSPWLIRGHKARRGAVCRSCRS